MKKILFSITVFIFSISLYSQNPQEQGQEIEKVKFSIIRELLTCHTLGLSLYTTTDMNERVLLFSKGKECASSASAMFDELKAINHKQIKDETITSLSSAVNLYNKMFTDMTIFNNPNGALSFTFFQLAMIKILNDLYCQTNK